MQIRPRFVARVGYQRRKGTRKGTVATEDLSNRKDAECPMRLEAAVCLLQIEKNSCIAVNSKNMQRAS
jgi:hypothetical protein